MVYVVSKICLLVALVGLGHSQEDTHQLEPPNQRFVYDYQQSTRLARLSETETRFPRRAARVRWAETKISTPAQDTPQLIKDQGNETKNYAVMVTADWCIHCKPMYPIVEQLKRDGYIFYVFDTTHPEFKDYETLYRVKVYPTFIVYDNGKEVTRVIGHRTKRWFTKRLKLKTEQITNIYDEI